MLKIILGVEGMKCPKCEAHMVQAVKENLKIKSVTASSTDNSVTIVAKAPIDKAILDKLVTDTGYKMTSMDTQEYEKKGFFSFGK